MKTFEEMVTRAEAVDYVRDKQRSEKADRTKRYEVCAYPAYHGSPIMTNSKIIAWLVAIWRMFGYAESRIIDRKTGRHIVL